MVTTFQDLNRITCIFANVVEHTFSWISKKISGQWGKNLNLTQIDQNNSRSSLGYNQDIDLR